MTESDRELIINLSQRQIPDAVFRDHYSGDISDKQVHIISLLTDCIKTKSGEDLEYTLLLADHFGITTGFISMLSEILPQDWHYKHEDIVLLFEKLKSPDTVDVLHETALKAYTYLDYDDSFGLARKCTWALAEINTADAKEKLKLLSNSNNQLIAGYAKKRLDNPA